MISAFRSRGTWIANARVVLIEALRFVLVRDARSRRLPAPPGSTAPRIFFAVSCAGDIDESLGQRVRADPQLDLQIR